MNNIDRKTAPLKWNEATLILQKLESEKKYNDLLLLSVGFFTGYRIGDILKAKYSDFNGRTLDIKESKTKKQRSIIIIDELRRIVNLCKKELNRKDEYYLFTNTRYNTNKPITVHTAIQRIKKILSYYKVQNTVLSSHTLRKTFALRYYEHYKKVVGSDRAMIALSKILNHSSTETTRTYICIDTEIEKDIFDTFF